MEINKNVQELGIMEDQEVYELSSRENGARIVFATDDYFGVAENLLKEEEPVQQEGFTNFGKRIMDGWVTKSRHGKSHDFAIIEFAADVKIDFICIDTAFFTNNFPIQFSIQSARRAIPVHIQNRTDRLGQSATMPEMERINQIHSEAWPDLLTRTNLEPGYPSVSKKFFVRCNTNWPSVTHLRLNIFPNGGVARLRVYGKTVHGLYQQSDSVRFDLISRIYNGRCVSYSSKHSGHPNNLLKPGSPINSDDGWETVKNMPNMKNIPLMAQQSEQSVVGEARDDVRQMGIPCSLCKSVRICSCASGSPISTGDISTTKAILERLERERDTARADVERLIKERNAFWKRLKMMSDTHVCEQLRFKESLDEVENRLKHIKKERQDPRRAAINDLEDQLGDVQEELRRMKQEVIEQRAQYFQLLTLKDQTDQALGDAQDELSQAESDLNKAMDRNRSMEQQQEWAIFMLGHIGKVHYVIIDTTYVNGNAPSFVHVEGLSFPAMTWLTLIPETKVIEGTEQIIPTLENTDMFMTEVKLTIKPSASINRFRAFGTCLFHETGQSCAN